MRVTISHGASFADLRKARAIAHASAAVDAVEALIRNSWTHSDIFLIEEAQEGRGEVRDPRPTVLAAGHFRNRKIA